MALEAVAGPAVRTLCLERVSAPRIRSPVGSSLACPSGPHKVVGMWSQPYLETCCRAALHRLYLCGAAGRPAGLADDPCLKRLTGMAFCCRRDDERYEITAAGQQRHATEVLRRQPGDADP